MIAIIYAGLAILPLGLLTFGVLFLKRKFNNLSIPLTMSVGLITLICEFLYFDNTYSIFLEKKIWNYVANPVSYFPLVASASMILVCVILFCILEILKFHNKKNIFKVLVLVGIGLLFANLLLFHSPQPKLVLHYMTTATEQAMRDVVDTNNFDLQLAIISNPEIPKDVIIKLSQSDNEMIRFYSTKSAQLSNERLQEMRESDASKEVRKQAANELEFNRKIKN